jgi:ABC-type enterochelin transport system permease subunit
MLIQYVIVLIFKKTKVSAFEKKFNFIMLKNTLTMPAHFFLSLFSDYFDETSLAH